MPGITYPTSTSSERDRVKRRGHHHHQSSRSLSASADGSQHDSLYPPPTIQQTGYGLNEPQWSPSGPPPLIYHRSPYATVPFPPLYPTRPALHSLLTTSQLVWDISFPPNTAMCSVMDPRAQQQWSSLPATDMPNVVSLTIRVGPFPTPIVIMPTRASYITVYDVLVAVYNSARRDASQRAGSQPMALLWQGTPMSAGGPASAMNDVVAEEVRACMRRCTRWEGLEPSAAGFDEWVLRTGPTVAR